MRTFYFFIIQLFVIIAFLAHAFRRLIRFLLFLSDLPASLTPPNAPRAAA